MKVNLINQDKIEIINLVGGELFILEKGRTEVFLATQLYPDPMNLLCVHIESGKTVTFNKHEEVILIEGEFFGRAK